jgi:hypothetical protein
MPVCAIYADSRQIAGRLRAIFRPIEAHQNEIRCLGVFPRRSIGISLPYKPGIPGRLTTAANSKDRMLQEGLYPATDGGNAPQANLPRQHFIWCSAAGYL